MHVHIVASLLIGVHSTMHLISTPIKDLQLFYWYTVVAGLPTQVPHYHLCFEIWVFKDIIVSHIIVLQRGRDFPLLYDVGPTVHQEAVPIEPCFSQHCFFQGVVPHINGEWYASTCHAPYM